MPKTLIYDCEILNDPLIHGWSNYAALGVTVIGFYTSWTDTLQALDMRDPAYLSKFQEIVNQADEVVGFNSISFDDNLLLAHGVLVATTCDLLCEIRQASGQPRHYVAGATRPGYSLGNIAQANGLGGKSGHGAEAPLQWQRGEYDAVIDYCLHDVTLTRQIYELMSNNLLVDPITGAPLHHG